MQISLKNNPRGTVVPNEFIQNCMDAPEGFIAVYLYTLMYSTQHDSIDIGILSARLKMQESDIIEAFEYWQKRGFAKILNGSEMCFEFGVFKKQSTDDSLYTESEFFQELQRVFGSRQLSPADYIKIFDYTTVFILPKKVVLLLADYCVKTKGKRVPISYMDKVAKSWAEQDINTEKKALALIEETEEAESGIHKILEQLGLNRNPTKDEKALLEKWKKEWGFSLDAIITACSKSTAASQPSMKYLDGILYRLRQEGNTTSRTISESKALSENLTRNIQEILHIIGEKNLTPSIEHKKLYQKWTSAYGYDMRMIIKAAELSSKHGRMPVKHIDDILTDWFNNGIEYLEEAETYINTQQTADAEILSMFEAAGVTKMSVSEAHRKKYLLWKQTWGMSKNTILLAAEISSLASQPVSYLNALITNWHEKGIKTLSDAQKETQKRKSSTIDNKNNSRLEANKRPVENYDHIAYDPFADEGA